MTSKLYALCPKCTSNIPSFIIDKNNHTKLKIKCKCGYNNSLSLYEYLDNYNKTKIEHYYTFTCLKHNLPFVSYSPLHSQHYCKDCNADQSELFMIMINDIQIDTIKENKIKEVTNLNKLYEKLALLLSNENKESLSEHIEKVLTNYDPNGCLNVAIVIYFTGARFADFVKKLEEYL